MKRGVHPPRRFGGVFPEIAGVLQRFAGVFHRGRGELINVVRCSHASSVTGHELEYEGRAKRLTLLAEPCEPCWTPVGRPKLSATSEKRLFLARRAG